LEWKREAERLYEQYGRQWSLIASELAPLFPDKKHYEIKEKIRSHLRNIKQIYKKENSFLKGTVGVYSDIHAPFNHPNYLAFVQDVFEQFRVDQIVCCGDIFDHHALSRFNSDPGAMGAYDEMDKAAIEIEKYAKAFPVQKVCKGNHDDIIERQAATLGIGKRCLKSVKDI
jgi:hypothetical protein